MSRPLLILAILALLTPVSLAAEESGEASLSSLRVVETTRPDLTREILFKEFRVLDDLGEFMVAEPAASDREAASRLGVRTRLIDLPAMDGRLLVVSLKGLTVKELSLAAAVLHAQGDIALASVPSGAENLLARPVPHFGLEQGFRPLNLERIPPARRFVPIEGAQAGKASDPRIAAMVAQVSPANIQNMVQDLQDMGERKAASGAHTAETYLVNAFSAIPGLTVTTHNFSGSYADNVIAELPGTVDPSVIYIIGAHYDSTSYNNLAPGADDNGSGTAGVVEIARILSQHQFKYTLRFACWSAEELGLIGSDAYCDDLVTQGANVGAYINLDMTAYRAAGDTYSVDFVTNYSSSSLISYCSDMYATYVPSIAVNQGSLSGGTSDHQSFTQHGYSACFPFEDLGSYSPYIHSPDDVIGLSANDFTLAEWITQGVLASIASLASPVDIEIAHTALGDTTDASGPYRVDADVSSLIGSNIIRVTLFHESGSGFVSKDMAPTGSGDGFISSIPGIGGSGYVSYYLEAEDDQGNTERLPDGLGADSFEFFVGYINDIFADDFEISDNGWTHGGTGQDDWMRDVPSGNGGYDPGYPASGTKIWGNDLGPSGYNGNYQGNVNNWLESPSIDCSGWTDVTLRYRRWLTVEEGQYDQARILVNGSEAFANAYSGDHIDTDWVLHDIDISAWAGNVSDVKLRFTLTTDSGVELGGWNIDDLHVGTLSGGDIAELSLSEVYFEGSTGGTILLNLDGIQSMAGRTYMLALSASGTSPGTMVNGVLVPLNRDAYTTYCMAHLNTYIFTDFQGTLDGNGDAAATFNAPVITDPGLIGATLNFAWVTLFPVDFASNPVDLLIVP